MSKTTVLPENLTVAQLIIQFPNFYRTCKFIIIFTTAYHLPDSPSHLISLVHPTSFFLKHILQGTTSF